MLKNQEGYIIMDNSLHELGKAYDTKDYYIGLNHLEPNEFIGTRRLAK